VIAGVRQAYEQDKPWTNRAPPVGRSERRAVTYAAVPTHDSEGKLDGVLLYAEAFAPDASRREGPPPS
jgi:hypothetical protein